MKFPAPLTPGTLVRRYKRFLADVELADGSVVTAHCPNSGSMKTCEEPGWPVMLTHVPDPKRKLKWTLEMTYNGTCWIGVNTQWPNLLVYEAAREGRIAELAGYDTYRREVKYGSNSRIDILAESADRPDCWIEVKNVTLLMADGMLAFPDAVTERGRKHLRDLAERVAAGDRAVMVFLCQRTDGAGFRAAHEIDPAYADELELAKQAGVEVVVVQAGVSPEAIELIGGTPRQGASS